MFTRKNRSNRLLAAAVCLSVFGILYALSWGTILKRMAGKFRTLRPNTRFGELWMNPPIMLKYDFYFFNWTNPEDFHDLNIKPNLKEIGPYSFYEYPEKYNMNWHEENETVSYRKRSQYHFSRQDSVGDITDPIITMNSLAVGIAHTTKYFSSVRRSFVDIAIRLSSHNDISLNKTVDELLYGGFDDKMINFGYNMPSALTTVKVPFDKFGYFYPRNSSDYGHDYNVYTGADNSDFMGQLNSWNFEKMSPFYGSSCSKIDGSAGEFYPPNLEKYKPVRAFSPELCRTVEFEYVETVEIKGILGYKYITGQRFVDNGTLYPETECYCDGECLPVGVANITACWYNVPVFVSYPHFYRADSFYSDQFTGLHPDPDIHEMYMVLEPQTGLIIDLGVRGQTSLYLESATSLRISGISRSMMFPLFWMNVDLQVTPELADELKAVISYMLYGKIFGYLCCAVGALLALYFILIQRAHRKGAKSELIEETVSAIEGEQRHQSKIGSFTVTLLKEEKTSPGNLSVSTECSEEHDGQCHCSF